MPVRLPECGQKVLLLFNDVQQFWLSAQADRKYPRRSAECRIGVSEKGEMK
jgi:hypothetical protein